MREDHLHGLDEFLDQLVIGGAAQAGHGGADIEGVLAQLAVVGADVEHDGQALRGVDAGAAGVKGQLAHGDAHAVGAEVAEAEDALAVGHDDHAHVGVVVDPTDYATLLAEIDAEGGLTLATRRQLALKAFALTARYDAAVAAYLSSVCADGTRDAFPAVFGLQLRKVPTDDINARVGKAAETLQITHLLDRLPNVYAEIGAITSDLGRQPRAAKRFFTKYQDRILFGKDAYNVAEYHVYFRLLETDDEYFDPIRKYHGIWKLYGLDLTDDVLKKLYYKNALRLFPSLSSAAFPP